MPLWPGPPPTGRADRGRDLFELSKEFWFDAAHTLDREIERESSARIHGHSYRAEITISGTPDATSGMVVDFGFLERELESLRDALDHRFLDEIEGLGPPTMENLCIWIWDRLAEKVANLSKITISRDSVQQKCVYTGPGGARDGR